MDTEEQAIGFRYMSGFIVHLVVGDVDQPREKYLFLVQQTFQLFVLLENGVQQRIRCIVDGGLLVDDLHLVGFDQLARRLIFNNGGPTRRTERRAVKASLSG